MSRVRLAAAALVILLASVVALWSVPAALAAEDGDKPADATQPAEAKSAEGEASKPAEGEVEKPWAPPTFTDRRADRDRMVRQIQAYGLTEKPVLEAMRSVPRHEFVPEALSRQAYDDGPLPIGYGQTISQPYIVAEMTRQLGLKAGAKVLEVGTGSGYQAAVLTHFTRYVYTMEIVAPLAEAAGKRLRRLGYAVVGVRHGDGYEGWPEKGPFDAIIVTCATGQIPPPLIKQLKAGGRMVIPVGGPFSIQRLMLVVKDEAGDVSSRSLMAVQFVPLLRRDPTRD